MVTRLKKILRFQNLLFPILVLAFLVIITGCVPRGTTVPRGWSGGTITDNTLFIGSMDGKIIAVNTGDGRRIWEAPLEAVAAPSGGFGCAAPPLAVAIYGSPAVSDNLVYIGGYNSGKFYAFAPGEKEPRWVYPREGTVGSQIVGGAVVAKGKVYFGTANGKVYALNAATGASSTGWVFPLDNSKVGKIWSTPAFLDGMLFIASFDKKLYAIDIVTGQKKWEFETQGTLVAPPLVDNNTVFIGSFDRNFYAVDANTGQEKWRFSEAKNWFWAKPLLKDNIIYAGNLDGKVYALDTRNGKKLTEFDLGGPMSASPVLAGNLVIVATGNGVVYSLNTESQEKRQLRDLAEKVDAPLVTDGAGVYVHTAADKLYAINIQSGAELWSFSLRSK